LTGVADTSLLSGRTAYAADQSLYVPERRGRGFGWDVRAVGLMAGRLGFEAFTEAVHQGIGEYAAS